jgi:NADH-quinone oxidoreductase subunit N
VVSKVAGLAGLVMVLTRMFPTYVDTWSTVVAVAAALTMTVGNLAALRQQHAVRLLAWSSVAQAGYLLVPLAAGGSAVDVGRIQAYALMYGLVNLGAFAVVTLLASRGATYVRDFTGLVRRSPLLGISLVFALLCLAGLPPGVVGLVAKVVIFQGAVEGDLTWLAVVLAVNVAIGLVYYLRFVVACVARLDPEPVDATHVSAPTPAAVQAVVVATFVGAVALSVFPAPVFAVLP